MSIISFHFFVFVAVALLLYYIFPVTLRWFVLLVASVYFFVKGCSIQLFFLFVGMALAAYICALVIDSFNAKIDKEANEAKQSNLSRQKNIVAGIAVIVEAMILILLKDSTFFINNVQNVGGLFGVGMDIPKLNWIAPIGVSYYTLILISYVLDVNWKICKPQRNPIKFLLFAGYFPQMVSGPFTRYGEMEKQLFVRHKFNYEQFCFGLQRFIWGLFKKLIIAERLGVITGKIYGGEGAVYDGVYVVVAAVSYCFQLYTDFSGCIDIIIGISEMFGIALPENFRTPFFSKNLSEFWRRWHMTLGLWVKDYVMFPVTKSDFAQKIGGIFKKRFGKKAGKWVPTYIGMFATWFTVGFWHGGSWKWIIGFGMYFFVLIVAGLLLEPVFKKIIALLRINTNTFSWKLFQCFRTFSLFVLTNSITRASSLTAGLKMWKSTFTTWNPWVLFDESLYKLGLDAKDFWVAIFALAILLIVSLLQRKGSVRQMVARQNLAFRWAIYLALVFSVIIFGCYGPGYNPADFIYREF
jgi:D-alanyl-lipoteichoic acid acyltransferase DltB (MBOAT superfamily)